MRKGIIRILCLILLVSISSAGLAGKAVDDAGAIAEWQKEHGDRLPWDYQVNTTFAREYGERFWENPSDMPVLPDGNDPETISPEKARKLAFRLIPEFGTEITADTLFNLTCVVASYRKPDYLGSFFSTDGSWDVQFWNTRGEEPEFVCGIYINALNENPDVFLLASRIRYECVYESPDEAVRIDPDGENDEAGQARMAAREIVLNRFSAGYGIDDYYDELTGQFGPFRFWTPEQKNQYCPVLHELLFWEKERIALYSGGDRQYNSEPLSTTVLQWRYGAPESVAVTEDTGRQKALDFLRTKYSMDCTDCRISSSLYTGHWHDNPFIDPYWVFGFYDGTERKAEIWVNANTGLLPKHRMDDAEAAAMQQFASLAEEGYEVGGRRVTEDMIDEVSVLYLEPEEQWYVLVAIGDSYCEIALDADTLELMDTFASNG